MIRVHNDGKGKWQSWEADLDEDSWDLWTSGSAPNMVGYGEDEAEAIEDLKKGVAYCIKHLQEIDYSKRIYVGYDRTPLKGEKERIEINKLFDDNPFDWLEPLNYRRELPKSPKKKDTVFLAKEGLWLPELNKHQGEIWTCLEDGEWIEFREKP